MNITLQAIATKSPSGKRAALLGFMTGIGKTLKEAKSDLIANVTEQLTYGNIQRWFKANDNKTLFLLYYSNGWAYDIMSPDYNHPSTCCMGDIPQSEAIRTVERHANTYI